MDTFQITVLVVAAVLLIIIFSTVGILSKYSTKDTVFPPVANSCPDNWTVHSSGKCIIPVETEFNVGNIYATGSNGLTTNTADGNLYTPGYDSGGGSINFEDPLWGTMGKSPLCTKKNWTNKNIINWDGVSNYNSCK